MAEETEHSEGVAPEHLRRALGDGRLASILTDAQAELLAARCTSLEYPAGHLVVREGETSDRLYLVDEGRVEVIKAEEGGGSFRIGELGPGSLFGDMSFLDGRPAAATIRVSEPSSILSLRREALEGGSGLQRDTYEAVLRTLGTLNVDRLRAQNDAHVAALRTELESTRLRNEAAQFLILIVIVFGIQNLAGVLIRTANIDTNSPLYEWGMLLMFLVPSLYFARRFGYSWAAMGVTTRNWRRSLLHSACIAPLLVGGAMATVWLLRRGAVLPADGPLLNTRVLAERPWESFTYLGHAGLQELGSRGIFQGSLQRFLGPEQGLRAVLVISMMFGILHLHLGMPVVSLAFFSSLFFGYLYLRQGTLLGVTLLHYLAGVLAQLLGLM